MPGLHLADDRLLYVQVNEVQNRGSLTLEQFFRQVFGVADQKPVERFVLDLRLNDGGDLELLKPVLTGLFRRDVVHQLGRFFTIIGRRTFSAAQYWVNELEKYTAVVFVGEPTAEAVNFYADAEVFQLPNSGIRVAASAFRWQQMFPWDARSATVPNIAGEPTSADYRANRDPALAAIADSHGPGGRLR